MKNAFFMQVVYVDYSTGTCNVWYCMYVLYMPHTATSDEIYLVQSV
jgi:hypothetical protein